MHPKALLLALAAIVFTSSAPAEVKIPKGVFHEAEEVDKAKADAAAKGKPIAVIWTSESSGCPIIDGASGTAIQDFKSKTVILFFKPGIGSSEKMPPSVQRAMKAPEAGKSMPIVVVFDAALEKVIATIPFNKDERAYENSIREATKKIHAARADGTIKKE